MNYMLFLDATWHTRRGNITKVTRKVRDCDQRIVFPVCVAFLELLNKRWRDRDIVQSMNKTQPDDIEFAV